MYDDQIPEQPKQYNYFSIEYGLDYKSISAQMSTYTVVDLLSDIGGLHDILCIIIELFVGPIAAHLWFLRAIKLLYIYKGEPLDYAEDKVAESSEKKEDLPSKHQRIELTFWQSLWRTKRVDKVYKRVEEMLDYEMDIVRVIKDLRNVRLKVEELFKAKDPDQVQRTWDNVKLKGDNVVREDQLDGTVAVKQVVKSAANKRKLLKARSMMALKVKSSIALAKILDQAPQEPETQAVEKEPPKKSETIEQPENNSASKIGEVRSQLNPN